MRTVRVTVLLTSLVLLGLAPAARAAGTVSEDATTITYQAQAGDADRFILSGSVSGVTLDPNVTAHGLELPGPDGVAIAAGAGCSGVGAIVCTVRPLATLNLDDGNDLAAIVGSAPATPATTVHGGAGNDLIGGSSSGSPALTLFGDGGDDTVIDGTGTDALDGGAGNDTLIYLAGGADDLRGGAGTDTVVFDDATGVVVTLNDQSDDGPVGAPVANVHSDVEVVDGTSHDDQLTGNADPNTLIGGGGADTLSGGDGNDTIAARDGVADAVDCGAGTDTAEVDAVDVVTGCETVQFADSDTDGVTEDLDCNDHDPATHPGAADIPGDGIDQDCSGADTALAPTGGRNTGAVVLPKVAGEIRASWTLNRAYAKLRKLSVSKVPAGGRIEVRCTGKGCAFARKSAAVKGGRVSLAKLFKGRKLKPGAVIEVRVTAPGMTGQVVRFTVRKGKRTPARSTLCLAAGAAKPAACA